MNDKVKQLAERAGFVFWNNEEWKPQGETIDWSCSYDKELEKFAELIIKECCDVLSSQVIFHSGYGYNQNMLHDRIKKQFEVKL
jgi:hypothetical protein